MKHLRLTLALIILAALAGSVPTYAAPGVPVARSQAYGAALDISYAYDYLAPYGTWLTLDPYGYVWCPRHMGYGWRPYSEGRWLWSDDGWFWDADEDWGWMPFHYGRWGWDNDCGWFWTPGRDWGPAWVFWRFGDLYCGWAPIPPGIAFGAGMDFDTLALGLPFNFWVFVNGSHFLDNDLRRFCLPYERNATIIGLTQFRNRYGFRGGRMIDEGIDVDSIRRATGHPVTRYALANADRPGRLSISGNEARVYRPSFQENRQAQPKQFMGREEARRELGTARIYEPPRQGRATPPEKAVRKKQAEERSMLQRSQAQERQTIQRRQTEELRKAPSPSDRAMMQQKQRAQMAEQQKKHQAEAQQMNERHRTETEQVRQSSPPKTTPRRK